MTSQEQTKPTVPPNADDILTQFSNPMLIACRVALLAVFRVFKWVRRVHWNVRGTSTFTGLELPVIFASNHQSHIDTHVILASLPKLIRKRTAVAAAYDHFADVDGTSKKKRMIQFFVASVWHAFGIDRIHSPISSIRTMQNLLLRKWSIVIYPEGTRSRTGEIAPFKPGFAVVAKKSGRPVIPICVKGGMDVLPEAKLIPRSGTMRVSFGEPLHFEQDESSADFMARVETAVRTMANDE